MTELQRELMMLRNARIALLTAAGKAPTLSTDVQQHTHTHYHYHGLSEQQFQQIVCKLEQLKEQETTHFMDLASVIQGLKDEVANNTTVEKSAVALVQGLATQLQAALAAASAAGATPEQLQALTDLQTSLKTNDADLAAAITANTPASTAPASTAP